MQTNTIQMNDGASLVYWERHAPSLAESTPVVLLHSLFFAHGMFDQVCSLLSSEWRVLVPDHRGQGASALTPSEPTMRRLSDDVEVLIETALGRPVHLVGSSMGGYIAQDLMLRRPDLLASCTLSCCTAQAESQPERFAALEQRIREQGPASMTEDLMNVMFGERFMRHGEPEVLARWRAHMRALPNSVADAVHGVFSRPGYLDRLVGVRVPVLLISGALDRAKRPEDMEQIAQSIPGSQHLVFQGSGHSPAIEEPERFVRELEHFWRAVDASPHREPSLVAAHPTLSPSR